MVKALEFGFNALPAIYYDIPFRSHDKLVTENQSHQFPVEYLNSIHVNGAPPHLLELKVGAPVMLIRNLDPTRGHVNGTRYIIKELQPRVIHAQIAVGPYKGKI